MITYPLDPPEAFCPQKLTVRARTQLSATLAPFSGVEQVQEWIGGHWEMELTFPVLEVDDGEELVGFIDQLNGQMGTFLFGDPKRSRPSGAAASSPGNPVVYGINQTGLVLTIATDLGSLGGYLLAGDMLSLGVPSIRHLHRVIRDVDLLDGVGVVNIWPRLRQIPNDGDDVMIFDAKGLFRLSVDSVQHEVDVDGFYHFDTLPIIEAVTVA